MTPGEGLCVVVCNFVEPGDPVKGLLGDSFFGFVL